MLVEIKDCDLMALNLEEIASDFCLQGSIAVGEGW